MTPDTPLSTLVEALSADSSFRSVWMRPEGAEAAIKSLVQGLIFMADSNKGNLSSKARERLTRLRESIWQVMDPETDIHLGRFDRDKLLRLMDKALATVVIPSNLASGRPPNYEDLSSREQWDVDKRLGILDWDGR